MTTKGLNRLVGKWQKRMRLQDWEIAAEFVPPGSLGDSVALAAVEPDYRTVQMKIQEDPPADVESHVVHELVHVRLWGWTAPNDREEGDINMLTVALVDAYRR